MSHSPSHGPTAVSPWVRRFAGLIPVHGTVLDLAAGGGRHTRFLIGLGHCVTAVDRDVSALADLRDQPAVTILSANLENGSPWPLRGQRFAGVVVANYLYRPLLRDIVASVAPGGCLIYETFAVGNERFGKPINPDFLLRPGELLEAVRGHLVVVAYENLEVAEPKRAVVQHIAAVRET